ncbi:MAG: D-glycero-alpha-D-manno-heptose-1,7-bisphosphate 7-phosphatase [Candidatus Methylomirabilia bacterium]
MPAGVCVFIDRDGTLVEEVGYINHPRRVRLLPRSAKAVRLLNEAGIRAVTVTNQSGVARGYFSEDVLQAVHAELVAQLETEGAFLDGIYVCPHHPTEGEPPYRARCDCRKPQPGLLLRASKDLNLDLSASYMVGDKIADVEAGCRAGLTPILVLTGYGFGEWEYRQAHWSVKPEHIAHDLLDAVEWILERRQT